MADKPENPNAFPVPAGWNMPGMTLRDYFAGQALAGQVSSIESERGAQTVGYRRGISTATVIAQISYDYADGMLAERARSGMTAADRDHVAEAVAQLRDHQRQIDADGAFVGVSRQALDEVLAYVGGGQ